MKSQKTNWHKKHKLFVIGLFSLVITSGVMVGLSYCKTNNLNQKVNMVNDTWWGKCDSKNRIKDVKVPLTNCNQFEPNEFESMEHGFRHITKNINTGWNYMPSSKNIEEYFPKQVLIRFNHYVDCILENIVKQDKSYAQRTRVGCSFDLVGNKLTLNFHKKNWNEDIRMFCPFFIIKYVLWLTPESNGLYQGQYKSEVEEKINSKPIICRTSYMTLSKLLQLYCNMEWLVPEFNSDECIVEHTKEHFSMSDY